MGSISHNFNHFTGKTRPVQTQKRKKKQKTQKKHVNKYEAASLAEQKKGGRK